MYQNIILAYYLNTRLELKFSSSMTLVRFNKHSSRYIPSVNGDGVGVGGEGGGGVGVEVGWGW